MPKIEIRGLRGLDGLSESQRKDWIEKNKRAGKITDATPWSGMDRIYRNQQYIAKYGLDDFKTKNANERDFIWKRDIAREAISSFNPYVKKGFQPVSQLEFMADIASGRSKEYDDNIYIKASNNLARANDMVIKPGGLDKDHWDKLQTLAERDPDLAVELIESGWRSKQDIEKEYNKREEDLDNNATLNFMTVGTLGPLGLLGKKEAVSMAKDVALGRALENNENLFNKTYEKYLNKQREIINTDKIELGNELLSNLGEDGVKKAFLKEIRDNNSVFSAYYDSKGNASKVMENYKPEDMAIYLAEKQLLSERIGESDARLAMSNYAESYVKENQGWWARQGYHGREFLLKMGSYTAAKATGLWERVAQLSDDKTFVYMNNSGEMIGRERVQFAPDGTSYYVNYKGEKVPLKVAEVSVANAIHNGLGADGKTMNWWGNAKAWNDAERFNVSPWSKKELERANDIGSSTSIVRYDPGETAPFHTQALQMGSYIMADLLWAAGTAGASKALGFGDKMLKGLELFNGLQAANAIGFQYEMGVFGENKQKNITDLESKIYKEASDKSDISFNEKYASDKAFKSQVDNYIKVRAAELKTKDSSLVRGKDGNLRSVAKEKDSYYESLAREEVKNKYKETFIEEEVERVKNSPEYLEDLVQANEIASSSASIAGATDALKYAYVNALGHRAWMFRSPAASVTNATKNIWKNITEITNGQNRRLVLNSALETGKQQWKNIGKFAAKQAWGGGWTNWTDEMQAEGGRQINNDKFAAYLNGEYAGEGVVSAYNPLESYYVGAMSTPLKSNAVNAFLVGAAGSLLPMPSINFLKTVGTKKGRAEFAANLSAGNTAEAMNMLFANGIINDYMSLKDGEKQVQAVIDDVNNLISQTKEFQILEDALQLDLANADATNSNDKEITRFLQALSTINMLKNITPENETLFSKVASMSTTVESAKGLVDKILNNDFTEEELNEYLKDWYAKNPSIPKSEENNQKGLEQIKKNAEEYKKAITLYEEAENKVDQIEEKLSEPLPDMVKYRIIQRHALDNLMLEKRANEEQEISGSTEVGTTSEEVAPLTFGNTEARKVQIRSNNNTITRLETQKEKVQEEIKEKEEEIEKIKEENKNTPLTDTIGERLKLLTDERESANMNLTYLNSIITSLKEENKSIEKSLPKEKEEGEEAEAEEDRVLTKDEILRLDPVARSRMLNKGNRYKYSEAQKKEIEALEQELILKDADLINRIHLQGVLQRHIEANRNSYSMMVQSPYAAAVEFESKNNHFIFSTLNSLHQRDGEALDSMIEMFERVPENNKEQISQYLFTLLTMRPSSRLRFFTDSGKSPEGLKNLLNYKDTIERAKNWVKLAETIHNVINTLEGLDSRQKKYLINSVDNIIKGTKSREEAEEALKESIKSANVNAADKSNLINVLQSIGLAVATEQATVQNTQTQENTAAQVQQQQQVQQQAQQQATPLEQAPVSNYLDTEYSPKELPDMDYKEANKTFGSSYTEYGTKESIKREESRKLKVTADYLNGKMTPSEYLLAMNYTEEYIDYLTTERVKEEADKQVELYKPYLNPPKVQQAGEEVDVDLNEEKEQNEQSEGTNKQENELIETDTFKQVGEEEIIDLDTPESVESLSLEEQVEEANKDGEEISQVRNIVPDTTDDGNLLPPSSENMQGNAMYAYDVDILKDRKEEVRRVGKKPRDPMNRFFAWLDNAGIKLQEIIDHELKHILKSNPNIEFIYINPANNATDDAALSNFVMLGVEYTDAVEKIHKEERGGVIQANNKRYLLVGTLGYNNAVQGQKEAFNLVQKTGIRNRKAFFRANPSERFYADTSMYTKIQKVGSGRIVKRTLTNGEADIRRLSQILYNEDGSINESRNPEGLHLQDLKFFIQYDTKGATVNVSDRNKIHTPKDGVSNTGNTFLLIESANGEYSPVYLEATMLNEISDGKLKEEINTLLNQVVSPDYNTRLNAVKLLRQWINLDSSKNILIGKPGNHTISTSKDGIVQHEFDVTAPDFSINAFIDAVMKLNPRINLTISNLKDKVSLQWLDEAGALRTDIAKLGTSNASYTVYSVGVDGKPIITETVEVNDTSLLVNSDLSKALDKQQNSVRIGNSTYRKRDNLWRDSNDNNITDPILIEQLERNSYIRRNNLSPIMRSKENEFFLINSDKNNPILWRRNSTTMSVNQVSKAEATRIINLVEQSQIEEARERNIKRQMEELQALNEGKELKGLEMGEPEPVDLGEEEMIEQTTGVQVQRPVQQQFSQETHLPIQEEKEEREEEEKSSSNNGATAVDAKLSLAELQMEKPLTDVRAIMTNRDTANRLKPILREKGCTSTKISDITNFLLERGVQVTGIKDVDSWMDDVINCH